MDSVEFCLNEMSEVINDLLRRTTGLGEIERKLIAFYTLATYGLDSAQRFPLLVLKGPMGTGKSKTMRVIKSFACRANAFSLRSMTLPTFRDELVACHEGTAVIEEADQGWKDDQTFERMLSDRYGRVSAETALKKYAGRNSYVTKKYLCFGASVLHRRTPFADTALNGRSIFIRFRANHERTYEEFHEDQEIVQYSSERLRDFEFVLPKILSPVGIAGRILDTYEPILAVAQMCKDTHFLNDILFRLQLETEQLKEAQSIEPVGIVLRALVEQLSRPGATFDFRKYPRISNLVSVIWESHRMQMKPHQVAEALRDLGFKTKNSHGYTVVVPEPMALLNACSECGYQDDAVLGLQKHMFEGRAGRVGSATPASLSQPPVQSRHQKENTPPSLPALPESQIEKHATRRAVRRISINPGDFEESKKQH